MENEKKRNEQQAAELPDQELTSQEAAQVSGGLVPVPLLHEERAHITFQLEVAEAEKRQKQDGPSANTRFI